MPVLQLTINSAENGHILTANDNETTLLYAAESSEKLKQIISGIMRKYLKDIPPSSKGRTEVFET